MATDLGWWLCNLYIEVEKLPREAYDPFTKLMKKEFDVEIQFMNHLLKLDPSVGMHDEDAMAPLQDLEMGGCQHLSNEKQRLLGEEKNVSCSIYGQTEAQ